MDPRGNVGMRNFPLQSQIQHLAINMAHTNEAIITFTEVDELNSPISTYVYSEQGGNVESTRGRIDTVASSASTSWSLDAFRSLLVDVFLPAGYPNSVSEDYVSYQVFDSLQAFSSSIAGLLSSRAVLQGVGVGNADASPTSALLLHILQDTSGRIATILFAHRVGTALEPECKMYRFAADIFNDLAMVLDCLSPMIPAGVSRVSVLSAAGVLRALCGVAGGSSKASLSAHFAKWGNLAEVNAKDSSQETVISLIGMLVGSLVVSYITSFTATWLTLILLLILHLSLNYAAVRSVQMTTLNRQRANIAFSALLSSDPDATSLASDREGHLQPKRRSGAKEREKLTKTILSPAQVARQERIFDAYGTLRWYPSSSDPASPSPSPETIGSCQIGVSLCQFLADSSSSGSHGQTTASSRAIKTTLPLRELTSLFADEDYILYLSTNGLSKIKATILLKQTSTPKSHLKAWAHALLAVRVLSLRSSHSLGDNGFGKPGSNSEGVLSVLSRTLEYLIEEARFEGWVGSLRGVGWEIHDDLNGEEGKGGSALETSVGRRVVVAAS
ncbi:vitamin B6 photo-protection and homoeostasis-domain-containing protein [Aspergillus karnatakaensis]|uniref:RUS1 family protein n=1 Tax=Aspergillus karnatakaensis TaxID=1810916 RepID=UPI003CCC9040